MRSMILSGLKSKSHQRASAPILITLFCPQNWPFKSSVFFIINCEKLMLNLYMLLFLCLLLCRKCICLPCSWRLSKDLGWQCSMMMSTLDILGSKENHCLSLFFHRNETGWAGINHLSCTLTIGLRPDFGSHIVKCFSQLWSGQKFGIVHGNLGWDKVLWHFS